MSNVTSQLGLAIIPTLPYLFDEPVEKAVEWGFRSGLRALVGDDAVRPLPLKAPVSADSDSSVSDISDRTRQDAAISWEEYKAEKQRARDERTRQREEKGIQGPWALLGFGSSEPKDKSE